MEKIKALVLFSGGLDSRLVLQMMNEILGVKNVEAVYCRLPFEGRGKKIEPAREFVKEQKNIFHEIDATKAGLLSEYMEIIRNPSFGRGVALNPCIDCRIFVLRQARTLADKISAGFLATGEVVGQRPMSQYLQALSIVDREVGLEGKILRPLSAKVLPETEPEKAGLVDRRKLEGIKGRQRKRQIELAKKYNISYPGPSGGCLLCEPKFCDKVKPLLLHRDVTEVDISLLMVGRHFLSGNVVLGKNKKENDYLAGLAKVHRELILIIPDFRGPSAVIKDARYEQEARGLIKQFSK